MDQYLRHEFNAMARLQHPNVVRVYDFDKITGTDTSFFTMELADGPTFFKATRDIGWDAFYELVVQSCRALEFIHSRNIIHYDIKPPNLLVIEAAHGRIPKLMDFHLAKEHRAIVSKGPEGTLPYMAPEVIRGTTVDRRADLYSFGIVLYEAATGRLPFDTRNTVALLQMHMKTVPPPPREINLDVPPVLDRLIMRLIEKDPDRRFSGANDIITHLNESGRRSFAIETAKTRVGYVLSGKFVGRSGQMDRLRSIVATLKPPATQGGSHIVCVLGEAGAGKTRLVSEFRLHCQLEGIPFFTCNCYQGRRNPYAPVLEMFRAMNKLNRPIFEDFLRRTSGLPRDILARQLSESHDADQSRPALGLHSGQLRQEVTNAFVSLVVEFCRTSPSVICFQDVHWADDATTEFLVHLGRTVTLGTQSPRPDRPGATKLVILCSARTEEMFGAGVDALINADDFTPETISLAPLGADDVADLLRSMLGADKLPRQFVENIARSSKGIPLFVEELMKFMLDAKLVRYDRGKWSVQDRTLDPSSFPDSAMLVFAKRSKKLDSMSREILNGMAVLDSPAPVPMLARMVGQPGKPFYESLAHLRDHGMVVEEYGEGSFGLTIPHAARRRFVYDQMPRRQRERLHFRCGSLLEEYYGGRSDEHLHDIAYHYANSPPKARRKAFDFAVAAGEAARRVTALKTALGHFETAARLLPRIKLVTPGKIDVLQKLAHLQLETDAYMDSVRTCRKAMRLARDPARRGSLERQIGLAFERKGAVNDAISHYEKALAIMHNVEVPIEIALTRLSLAWIKGYVRRDYGAGLAICREVTPVIESLGTPDDIARLYNYYGALYDRGDQFDKSHEWTLKSAEIHRRNNNEYALAESLNDLAVCAIRRKDFAGALRYCEEGLRLSEKWERAGTRAHILHNLGVLHGRIGSVAESRRCFLEALQIAERLGHMPRIADTALRLATLFRRTGALSRAAELIERSLIVHRNLGIPAHMARVEFAAVCMAMGCVDEAVEHLDMYDLCEVTDAMSAAAHANLIMGRARRIRGEDPAIVRRFLLRAAVLSGRDSDPDGKAAAAMELARLCASTGRHDKAMKLIEAWRRKSESLSLAETKALLSLAAAEIGLEAPEPDDVRTGQDAASAVEQIEKLEMTPLLWRAYWTMARWTERAKGKNEALEWLGKAGATLHKAADGVPKKFQADFMAQPMVQAFMEYANARRTS
jgi:tetratricopeptide (TPR) repeat protein